jgi:hypothetical protein
MPKPQFGRQRPSVAFLATPDGVWTLLEPISLGFLPDILLASDRRPVKEQLEDRYRHGGGWRPIAGFKMRKDYVLRFPGDPPYIPSAMTMINDEVVIFYQQCSLLCVEQPDKSFEVSRVD